VGDSAAGKTTISSGIAKILGVERVTVICTDDYHRYNRVQRREIGISALDPECNYIEVMEQHLDLLRRGHAVLKPVYNHSTGDFDPPDYIEPAEFIIAEGLLGFHSKELRRQYDVRVYLAPEEELRVQWKIKRDTTKRGYAPDEVRASLKSRIPHSRDFIQPQQQYADVLVNFYRPSGHEEETGAHLNTQLMLRPTLPHPDLTEIVSEGDDGCLSSTILRKDDWLVEELDISGEISDRKATAVEELIWERLMKRSASLQHLRPEQIGGFQDGTVPLQSHPLALTQLLIAYQLLLAREDLRTSA
jgi:phosphoribulokinase